MFKILGSDGKEYGPVSADVVRQWIQERRANGQTRVQLEGTIDWTALADLPEFAPALVARESSPPPPLPPLLSTSPTAAAAPTATTKTSGLAIASLVLGVLGFCGITALLGIVFGIVAQVSISRSNGRLKGRGLAIAGMILSAFMLLVFLAMSAAILLPALAKAKQKAEFASCENNVRQVSLAIRLYADENEGKCPQAANWCDAVLGNLSGPETLRCPQRRGDKSGFAFNAKLAGRTLSSIPPDTVMLFESSGGWNFAGDAKDLVSRPPHGRNYIFGFADGSVRQVNGSELAELRWEP